MTRRVLAVLVLLGPIVLAFVKGGYFDVPRQIAGIVACALVVLAALVAPFPQDRSARVALGGLAALTAWTGASILWAPVAGPASADFQRLLLYLAAFTAALMLLPGIREHVAPVLLAGIVAAALYGLSERLLPGVFALTPLPAAENRLAWPLTYWNAMGALTGMGLVLAAGMRDRLSAAAAPLLGLACYLTFSRGALGATAAGLAVLVLLAPDRLRRVGVVVVTAGVAAACTIALPALKQAGGGAGGQGVAMLVLLIALGALAAAFAEGRSPRPHHVRAIAYGALALVLVGTAFAVTRTERHTPAAQGATPSRLVSAQSNRYDYWRVAASEFAHHPLIGGGASSFRVEWLEHRKIAESVHDAHELYLETAAELGLVGLAALGVFLFGIVGLARQGPALIAAALVTYAVHAGLDWDWEMPALTLVALLLAAAAAPRAASSRSPAPPSPAAQTLSTARTDEPIAPT